MLLPKYICNYSPYYCNGSEHCLRVVSPEAEKYFYSLTINKIKMKELFEKLKMNKGKIISSASCTQLEIAEARACDRFYVDDEGCGFVYFPEQPTVSNVIQTN